MWNKLNSLYGKIAAIFLLLLSTVSALVPLLSATRVSPAVATRTV